MITRTAVTWHTGTQDRPRWQHALADAVRDPGELLAALDLPDSLLPAARSAAVQFGLCVPRGYLARMERGNPRDPLLLQVLPTAGELKTDPAFGVDPVGDRRAMPRPGLLHKYHGRVLLVTTGACAIHCRYCFRRHFPYSEANPGLESWREALSYIASDASIEEVILSGGDPLSLSDRRLAALVEALDDIAHVRRLRIHTRQPIVLPERVDEALLAWLDATRLQTVVVVHANHPHEIDTAVVQALGRLRGRGATLLNQSVLLREVNDDSQTLARLSETLFEAGVLPYYLHLLDPVQGAVHFDVDEARAGRLMESLRARLPGYLVPRLVREIPGRPGKTPR
ncbi:MAG TPA: EF-P beta-lysylation protein EpmB [Gammaproteobacteria bacterium]|nr:EF-P beta-lysylation protein EpmB [Gammaproteobacteria bacterium]